MNQPIAALFAWRFPAAWSDWLVAERERWALWIPVAFGAGIAVYFTLDFEPGWWIGPALLLAGVTLGLAARRHDIAAVVAIGLCAFGLGLSFAQWRTHAVAAPVLAQRWGPAELTARVVYAEIRPEGRRLVLDRVTLPGTAPAATPAQIRVRVGDERDLRPGDRVALRAILFPPPPPAAPGAYDFQFQAWFARLGAVGTAQGPVRVLSRGDVGGFTLWLNAMRQATVERVMAAIPGPAGAVAAAILTGEQGAIPNEVLGWMRDSGLAHILSVSGLHISMVAGIVFLIVRRGLALVPPVALRFPIKKWAAGAAFVAISFYTVFTGTQVPTARSWIMASIVLFAILIDRTALTMRLVAWAAVAVLLIQPDSVVGPSFQMSFAAVVALIAAWEAARGVLTRWRADAGIARRAALALTAAAMTSLVAGLASAPFALYHFNRFTLYGLIANMIVIPLTGLVIMPAAVLAFLLLPLGVDGPALWIMGQGVDGMIAVGRWVAGWDGAATLLPAMPVWAVVLVALGGLWLAIWQRRPRLFGTGAIAVGLASMVFVRGPDVLVSGDGRLIAVRGADGQLHMSGRGRGGLTRETWLRRDGQEGAQGLPAQGISDDGRFACDRDGCVYTARGHVVAFSRRAEAMAEDCRLATVLVALATRPRDCIGPRFTIDRVALTRDGGHAIWLEDSGDARALSVNGARGERPWVRANTSASGR